MSNERHKKPDTWKNAAGQQFSIRSMSLSDISSAMRLKQLAGWNQTLSDWKRFLALEPEGSFVATCAEQVVGTVTTCSFPSVTWIGMMLVDPAYRRQGIGTRLMCTALSWLDATGRTCIRLDATSLGAPVYRKLGFQTEQKILRVGGIPRDLHDGSQTVRVCDFRWEDWPSLSHLDQLSTGADRTKLLKRLLTQPDTLVRVVRQSGRLSGFFLRRPGSRADQIGPLVALGEDVGRALLVDAMQCRRHGYVLIDIPAQNRTAMAAIQQYGLGEQRSFLRMVRGAACEAPSPYMWAGSGPEKG